jgi:hypothetical protein
MIDREGLAQTCAECPQQRIKCCAAGRRVAMRPVDGVCGRREGGQAQMARSGAGRSIGGSARPVGQPSEEAGGTIVSAVIIATGRFASADRSGKRLAPSSAFPAASNQRGPADRSCLRIRAIADGAAGNVLRRGAFSLRAGTVPAANYGFIPIALRLSVRCRFNAILLSVFRHIGHLADAGQPHRWQRTEPRYRQLKEYFVYSIISS